MEEFGEDYEKVTKLMINFKFKPQIQGFEFIRSAVLYVLKTETKSSCITTKLYPYLAKKFNTNQSCVERSIRRSIDLAFGAGGLLSINDYYGGIVYTNNIKFSNSEVISILVEIIRLDSLKRRVCETINEN